MTDTTKKQEREELHRAIWAIADELRGAVDGWDFKNYVLGTMFYRYISENLTIYVNQGEKEAGNQEFDYAKMSDSDAEEAREGLVEEKGFFILPSELFCNVRKSANDEKAFFTDREGKRKSVKDNLNELLEMIFSHIEGSATGSESEGSFSGLFDDFDVNSNKLGSTVAKRNERLAKLLDGVANMNLGSVKNHDIDDRHSIAYELHTKAVDILEGRRVDPTFYPVVYGLKDDEDWEDEANWYKVNPSLGYTVDIERLRDHVYRRKCDSL